MGEQSTIQRFPFKSLGSSQAGSAAIGGFQAFQSFPKGSANAELQKKTAEDAEKQKEMLISEKDIIEARQKSFEEGYAKGYSSAKIDQAEIDKKIQENLNDISIKLVALGEVVKTRNNAHIKELAELVVRIARKVAGDALKTTPYDNIENTIRSCLPMLFDEPKITIFVQPEIVEEIKARVAPIAQNIGFKNNIEICGNPSISAGNCNVEWNGGGIRSNKDAIWSKIEELCSR